VTEVSAPPARQKWFDKHWKTLAVACVVFLAGLGIGALTVGTKTKTETVAGPTVVRKQTVIRRVVKPVVHTRYRTKVVTRIKTVTSAPAPPPAPSPSGPSDKDFAVADLQIQDDGPE
jgi:hypothetical protein